MRYSIILLNKGGIHMKITLRGKNIEITEAIEKKVADKLSKLDKYFIVSENVEAKVLVRTYPYGQYLSSALRDPTQTREDLCRSWFELPCILYPLSAEFIVIISLLNNYYVYYIDII